MSLWDKVSKGASRVAKAAEDAVDEGKLRLAAYQARQRADKKAETLGYAVARGRAANSAPDETAITALVQAVIAADAEAAALEARARDETPPRDETSP
jgi:hypothetical protein